jgi:hypothetical protein
MAIWVLMVAEIVAEMVAEIADEIANGMVARILQK